MCCCAIFCTRFHRENNGFSMSMWKVACYLGGKVMQVETRRSIRTIELICGQLNMQVFFIIYRGMFSSSHHIFQSPLLSSSISSLIISRVVVESTIKSRSFLSCNKRNKKPITFDDHSSRKSVYLCTNTRGFTRGITRT